ncbi:CRISPR-associated RAMP protein Csx10 [Candidatus Chloroploca sp. Khr17]|uniref:type III-D CRISPR-associated RAMP protein Csx10 n=1 Tax=Candidatus Chloroploca sp. Khr17 TaxID=2496869 RepID=UPI00101B6FE0|nr:CRISPR-associated RAMP protein Csx10 [Candidatus Chloroploca sp. Khr17]
MLLKLEIEAVTPLAFTERRPNDQFRASLPYIPGGAIFGALGTALAAKGAFDPTLFRALRCHNAYPSAVADTWVRPMPLTALQPKGEKDATISDSLVARICWERQQPPALIYAPSDAQGRPWVAAGGGFYTLTGDTLAVRKVTQRVLTRVAINRRRRTAEDSRLYSPLVLNEVQSVQDTNGQRMFVPTRFVGTVLVPADAPALHETLPQLDVLGARTSTGLGGVTLTAGPLQADDGAAVAARIDRLTQRFREQAMIYKKLGGKKWMVGERNIFTVNLLADAILLDQGWLPTQQLSVAMLREATGIEADLALVRAFTVTKSIAGWHTTWQQPKPANLAVGMGSVFVFLAAAPLSEADCAKLAELQQQGIGERRQEGYGQIRICDEFHSREMWQKEEA